MCALALMCRCAVEYHCKMYVAPFALVAGDMWAHNYLQAENQIAAEHQDEHVWATDGPDAEVECGVALSTL